jgi:peptidoglycan/LPS O-acetylase OafA/YrhL
MSNTQSTGYRADLDGLRAAAITLVVIFHAFPTVLPGGFAGVDVFLVLSGYLGTAGLLGEMGRGSFAPLRFYLRRARRIVPALVVMLAGCLVLGWWMLLPGEYQQLGKHVAGGAGFIPNFVLYNEAGYFDTASETKPLLHLWYLGIDAQFYLVWPLLLWGLVRRGWALRPAILVLMALSFAFNLYQVATDPSAAYFLPFSRVWELALGGLLAVGTIRPRPMLALIGAALLVVAVVLLDRGHPYPGWWALLPTLGTAGLILAGPDAWPNRLILARPAVVALGAISYPLYLWHWPLLTLLRLETEGAPTAPQLLAVVAASLVLAWATWRLVDRAVQERYRGPMANRVILGGQAACILAGLAVFAGQGVPGRMPLVAAWDAAFANQAYIKGHDLFHSDRQECNFYDVRDNSGKAAIDPACHIPSTAKAVFVWGDSHSQHLQYGLRKALGPDVSVLQVAASGCIPSLAVELDDPVGACNHARRFAMERIRALKPQVVLLAQEGHHEDNDYAALIAQLRQAGVGRVILVGPVPHWKPFLYQVVERKYGGQPPRRTWDNQQPGSLATDRWLKQHFGNADGVTFVSLIDQLCNADGCPVYLGDDPLAGLTTYDYGHFTLPMSDYVGATVLAPVILDALR